MKLKIGVMCIVLISLVTKIQSMVLKGPTHSRYDPCGLGTVHFDKVANATRWMGVFNIYLYPREMRSMLSSENDRDDDDDPQIGEIELYIKFRGLVTFSLVTLVHQNAWISIEGDNSTIVTLKPRGQLPKKYIFFVNVPSENDVPIVTELKLNQQTLCSDDIRALQANQFKETHDGQKVCGSRSLNHAEMVTTDAEVKNGEWPWHVAIFVVEENKTSPFYQCGGSIISNTAVLTAGHCIEMNKRMVEAKNLMVLAGTNNVKDFSSEGAQLLKAEEVIVHPSYSNVLATADLAIIKVAGFRFTEYVQPVCLWGPTYDKAQLFGRYATIVGYGLTEDNTFHDQLRSSNTLIQTDETCKNQDAAVYAPLLNEFTFCVGYGKNGGPNTRNGDSGGGLVTGVLQPDNRISWYLTGVLSKCGMHKGARYCDADFYTVYTNVAAHATWIQHHLRGIDRGDFDKIVETADVAGMIKL